MVESEIGPSPEKAVAGELFFFFRPNNPAALPLRLGAPASAHLHQPHRSPVSHLRQPQQRRAASVRLLQPRGPSLLRRGRRAKVPSAGGLERAAAAERTGLEGAERRQRRRLRLKGLVRHWRRCRRLAMSEEETFQERERQRKGALTSPLKRGAYEVARRGYLDRECGGVVLLGL